MRIAVLVLGMHRSGTSAAARIVSLLGADLPKHLMAPTEANAPGHWEPQPLVDLNDELLESASSRWDDVSRFPRDWYGSTSEPAFRTRAVSTLREEYGESRFFTLKDPRICRIVPFWLSALTDFEAAPSFVLTLRNPLEVAASLKARDGFPFAKGLLLWLRHTLDAEHHTRGHLRALLSYERLLDDWESEARRVSSQLQLSWPRLSNRTRAEVDRFLAEQHRHHDHSSRDLARHAAVRDWVTAAYGELRRARDAEDVIDTDALDAIRSALDEADAAYGPVLAGVELDREEQGVRIAAQSGELERLGTEIAARDAELERIRHELAGRSSEVERLQAELAGAAAERDRLSAQVDDTSRELEARANEIASRDREVERLGTELAARDAELEVRGSELEGFQQKLRTALERSDRLSKALEAERARLHARDAEMRSREQEVAAKAERLNASQDEVRRLVAARRASLAENREARRELDRQANLLSSRDKEIERLTARVELFSATLGQDRPWRRRRTGTRLAGWVIRGRFRDLSAYRTLRRSRAFDPGYYLAQYPEVLSAGQDPLLHYVEHGAREGRKPNPGFDPVSYSERHPELADTGENPLLHALRSEKGPTHAGSEEVVAETSGDPGQAPEGAPGGATEAAAAPAPEGPSWSRWRTASHLASWVLRGRIRDLRAYRALKRSNRFDPSFYCTAYPAVAGARMNPLLHYVEHGAREGRKPNPEFDPVSYSDRHPELADTGENPLVHFLRSEPGQATWVPAESDGAEASHEPPPGPPAAAPGPPAPAQGPRALRVENLRRIDDRSFFAGGWMRDEKAPIVRLTAVAPDGARAELLESAARTKRTDVSELYASAWERNEPGFFSYFRFPHECRARTGWRFEIENSDGNVWVAEGPEVTDDPVAVRAAIVSELDRAHDPTTPMMEHVVPAITSLQRRLAERVTVERAEHVGPVPAAPKVSIVVPLYSRIDLVQHQLAGFADDPEFSRNELIYVLDSPELGEPLLDQLGDLYEIYRVPLRVLTLSQNGGFSVANNIGAEHARGRLLVLLNSDVLPTEPGWVGRMASAYDSTEGVGALGPKLLFEDGTLQHAGLFFRRPLSSAAWENAHYFKGLQSDLPAANVARPVPAVTAACMMIDRELYREAGGLSLSYVQGDYEDSDLCLSLIDGGRQNWYFPEVELYHLEGRSYSTAARQVNARYNSWLQTRRWGAQIGRLMSDRRFAGEQAFVRP